MRGFEKRVSKISPDFKHPPNGIINTLHGVNTLVPEKSNFAILDKSIRAQALWQDLKSQIAKAK